MSVLKNFRSSNRKSQSLDEHLSQILTKLLIERPENPLDYLTQLSYFVSDGEYVPRNEYNEYSKTKPSWMYSGIRIKEDISWARKFIEQMKKNDSCNSSKDDDEEQEEQPEEEEEEKAQMENLLQESKLLELVGISLTDEEYTKLMLSMKKLADEKPISSIRFFGKIFCVVGCYYIFEAELKEEARKEEEQEEEPKEEEEEKSENKEVKKEVIPPEKYVGTNRYQYYVTTDLDGDWHELPDATPEHIQCARKIKKYFTGNLEAEVLSHPPFPGQEKHYLRSQIARISAATVIAPKGLMEFAEPPEEEEEDEEGPKKPKSKFVKAYTEIPELKKAEKEEEEGEDEEKKETKSEIQLNKLDSWVHILPTILYSQGRCTLYKAEEEEQEEEEEEEEGEAKPDTTEQILPLLAPITDEDKTKTSYGEIPPWALKEYLEYLGQELVCLRSTRWPGAFAIGKKDMFGVKFINIYIGYGHKYGMELESPSNPCPILHEFEKLGEENDPPLSKLLEYKEPEKPKEKEPKEEGEGEEEGEKEEDEEEGEEEEEN